MGRSLRSAYLLYYRYVMKERRGTAPFAQRLRRAWFAIVSRVYQFRQPLFTFNVIG